MVQSVVAQVHEGPLLQFNNVTPLFRKKDGTNFFTMFQDTRRSDQFALSLWAMQVHADCD